MVCGEIGHYRFDELSQYSVGCPNMTEKLLTFPSPTPSPTSRDPGDGSICQKSTFFAEQHQHKQQRHLYRDMRSSRIFFCRGGGVGGGGPSSSTYFTVYVQRGSNGFITHFPGGGGVQMLISIETHNYNL